MYVNVVMHIPHKRPLIKYNEHALAKIFCEADSALSSILSNNFS